MGCELGSVHHCPLFSSAQKNRDISGLDSHDQGLSVSLGLTILTGTSAHSTEALVWSMVHNGPPSGYVRVRVRVVLILQQDHVIFGFYGYKY